MRDSRSRCIVTSELLRKMRSSLTPDQSGLSLRERTRFRSAKGDFAAPPR